MDYISKSWICLSKEFLSLLHHKQSGNDGKDYFSNLNDDMITEIFCKLPVDSIQDCKLVCPRWHCLISSKPFVDAQLKRATSDRAIVSIAMFESIYCFSREGTSSVMFFIEDDRKTKKLQKVCLEVPKKMAAYSMELVGSCNGILLLKCLGASLGNCSYTLCNPMTKEAVTLMPPGECALGFFFDKLLEYKLILYSVRGYDRCLYALYGLRTKHYKSLGTSLYRPFKVYANVSLSHALFWMVEYGEERPPCPMRIMMFKLDDESINVMPHPDNNCQLNSAFKHGKTRLLDVDDSLAYAEYFGTMVNIWILKDVVKSLWIKTFVVNLQVEFNRYPHSGGESYHVKVLQVFDGKLLLAWPTKGLFWYDLRSKIVSRINSGSRLTWEMLFGESNAVTCIKSVVSPKQILACS